MVLPAVLTYIPSPPANGVSVGPVRLHVYGLLIAAGVVAAVWLAQRRWSAIGGRAGTMSALAVWGVPGGLIGARVYSLVTSWNVDTDGGRIINAFEIWRGGLGIWGGVAGGILTGAIGARRAGLRVAPLLDCVAPAFALAQAIGRWGNYFNQELYGTKSGLPWAVKIDHPPGYLPGTTFQPTFLYEFIWDLFVCGAVIWVERRFRIRRGYLFTVYAALYTFGRFFVERMRIDQAHKFFGLRLNDWSSILVFVVAVAVLLWKGRGAPGDELAGDPLPPGSVLGMPSSPDPTTDTAADRPAAPTTTHEAADAAAEATASHDAADAPESSPPPGAGAHDSGVASGREPT